MADITERIALSDAERVDDEFGNVWRHLEQQRTDLNAQTQATNIQITSLTKDVQALVSGVGKLAATVDVLGTRIANIERPNIDLWLRLIALVVMMGGMLWAMAIRPVQDSIKHQHEVIELKLKVLELTLERKITDKDVGNATGL